MNKNTRRALFADTLAQVRDNLAFRILVGVTLLCVGLTFAFGFREDHLQVFFFWDVPYSAMQPNSSGPDAWNLDSETHRLIVDQVQILFVNYIIGLVLIVISVLATSFFVPQALEKGLVDTVLSKPVSRTSLLMSRYVAGLLFVAPLSIVLVGGAHLGFLAASGYSDPGFLWNALVLILVFAVYHAISVVAGVYTRSAIAAFLLTALFWFCNWLVHFAWLKFDNARDIEARMESSPTPGKKGSKDGDEKPSETKPKDDDGESSTWSMIGRAVAALHYALPKTADAVLIAGSLRHDTAAASKELVDEETKFSIAESPSSFTREARSSLNRDEGLLWIAPHPTGLGEARWTLKKQKIADSGSRSSVVKALKKRLEDDPNVVKKPTIETSYVGGHLSQRFEWEEKRGEETRLRRQWAFQGEDQMYVLDYDAEADWAAKDDSEHSARVFISGFKFDDQLDKSQLVDAHVREFGWNAPWRHNAWFSIGTTLAFIAAVLGIGAWKLSRVDF